MEITTEETESWTIHQIKLDYIDLSIEEQRRAITKEYINSQITDREVEQKINRNGVEDFIAKDSEI